MLEKQIRSEINLYLPSDIFEENKLKARMLKKHILNHPVFTNPILESINEINNIPINIINEIHCEYQHSIVQIFTDALLAAAFSSTQLETVYNLPLGSKIIPRFLLMPNLLDEFGLEISSNRLYGSIRKAHYPLFLDVINTFNHHNKEASKVSKLLRTFVEDSYKDYHKVITLLAVVEFQVICFTPVLKKIISQSDLDIDFNEGYYHVHGITTSLDTNACDDEHAEDLLTCLALIIEVVPHV
ncbi:MAG: hypothetical protein RBT15_08495 [Gudongella sp.]|jgi:hypothetical protein|nr:hypothetical protein [Gudongella sp.]